MRHKYPIAVVAGSYREFLCYCEHNKKTPDKDAVYTVTQEGLQGRYYSEIVTYGTWYNLKYIRDILFELNTRLSQEVL